MKNNIIRKLSVASMIVFIMSSCFPEQEVAPIDSPTDNAEITISPAEDYTNLEEGDTIVINVNTSKMLLNSTGFDINVLGASTMVEGEDFTISGGTIPAFAQSTSVQIVILNDDAFEDAETLSFELDFSGDPARNYQLTEESAQLSETFTYEVANVNDPGGLVIKFEWSDASDFDLLVEHTTLGSWSYDGATANNPEWDMTIRHDYAQAYDGVYHVGIDPYDVEDGTINFEITVGYPDGTFEVFEGVWNNDDRNDYPTTPFSVWAMDMYHLLTIEKTGSSYDVDYVFE